MKTINFPASIRQLLIDAPPQQRGCAVRLGRLYFDNQYWCAGETVYLRSAHKIIRTAQIVGELKCCAISDLSADDLSLLPFKPANTDEVVAFLTAHYEKPVTPSDEVTVVYYDTLVFDPELLEFEDDPHM